STTRFGHRKIASVTHAAVAAGVNELVTELAAAPVCHSYVSLVKVMQYAELNRLIGYYPCSGIKMPRDHDTDGFEPVSLIATQAQSLVLVLVFVPFEPRSMLIRFAAHASL